MLPGVVMLAGLALAAAAHGPAAASPAARISVLRRVASMGTTAEVEIAAATREDGLAASEAVIEELRRVEDLLTTWRDSPLRRLNEAPPAHEVAVGTEVASVLREVLSWAARTDRAFDPTVAPLVRAWDLRGSGRFASAADVAAALEAVGPEKFAVDPAHGSARRLHPAAAVDEGAWGKGYALDVAARRLAAGGVSDARVDLGGQQLALGTDASGAPWEISVADPRDRRRAVLTLSLSGLSVSTSANSERGRTVSGVRLGHELDPRTGRPAADFGSATVLSPSGLTADVLSTAFFVLGPEKGLELSDALRREGVRQEVLFLIDEDGARLRSAASPSFSQHVLEVDADAVAGLAPAAPARRNTR